MGMLVALSLLSRDTRSTSKKVSLTDPFPTRPSHHHHFLVSSSDRSDIVFVLRLRVSLQVFAMQIRVGLEDGKIVPHTAAAALAAVFPLQRS